MKVLDVAAAFAIGLLAVATLSVWTPAPFDALTRASRQQAAAAQGLYDFVSAAGLPFLQDSTMSQLCAALLGASNSTLQMTAVAGTQGCGRLPPPGQAYANLTLAFPTRTLVLQAW